MSTDCRIIQTIHHKREACSTRWWSLRDPWRYNITTVVIVQFEIRISQAIGRYHGIVNWHGVRAREQSDIDLPLLHEPIIAWCTINYFHCNCNWIRGIDNGWGAIIHRNCDNQTLRPGWIAASSTFHFYLPCAAVIAKNRVVLVEGNTRNCRSAIRGLSDRRHVDFQFALI